MLGKEGEMAISEPKVMILNIRDFVTAEKDMSHQFIGGTLVDIVDLKNVLQILIDDYTVAKLEQDGSLIDVELLNFQAWVNAKYPS